jgi:hypothetical protein
MDGRRRSHSINSVVGKLSHRLEVHSDHNAGTDSRMEESVVDTCRVHHRDHRESEA